MSKNALFLVMGVSGVGKSTLAEALAKRCNGVYLDADAFHPPENVAKMKSSTPLNDSDRAGWLSRLNAELRQRAALSETVFLACSAVKESHRAKLTEGLQIEIIFLTGPREIIRRRMEQRRDHYMPATLLDSQFAILEEPAGALRLDSRRPPAELIEQVRRGFPDLDWS